MNPLRASANRLSAYGLATLRRRRPPYMRRSSRVFALVRNTPSALAANAVTTMIPTVFTYCCAAVGGRIEDVSLRACGGAGDRPDVREHAASVPGWEGPYQ